MPHDLRLHLQSPSGIRTSLLQLQRVLGNSRARTLLRPRIQRQPVLAGPADVRDFIQATIRQFTSAASFFPLATLDDARFERVINSWYLMVVDGERMINDQLAADPALISTLRAGYTAAIRALITRAASQLGRTEADLYRENRGRIPMWAWATAHHMETGISTPIPEGVARNARTGRVTMTTNGFNITIFPDVTNDRSVRSGGETRINLQWGGIGFATSRTGRITRVTGPRTPVVHIRTRYARGANPEAPSAYGRGTTPADIAGGRVTPASTRLRTHEGSHGLDFMEFLGSNPPPQFTGVVGMTGAEFRSAVRAWQAAARQYADDINAFSTRNTDCVGTTIDDFHRSNARRGQRIVLECGP